MALTQVQGGMILPSTTLTTPIVATTMGVGGATPAASGSGITFPATQSASTDSNTLDDYEEGTWTPSVGGNATYGAQQYGWYIKVGKLVTVAVDMSIGTLGTGSTQLIGGLPFSASGNVTNGGGAISYFASLTSSVYSITTQLSGTTIAFITTTSAQTTCNNTPSVLGNGSRIIATISYQTAS